MSTIASPCRSTNLPSASAAPSIIGPNTVSIKSSAASFWTNAGHKKRLSKGTGPQTYLHMGGMTHLPIAVRGGIMPPPGAPANVAAATRRVEPLPARTAVRSTDGGESLLWRKKSSC